MKDNKKFNFCTELFLYFLILPVIARADISYLDLKGVHELIQPEFQNQLSPVFAYSLLGTGSLENRRFYGNYGPKNNDHSCLDNTRIGDMLKTAKDCPQDFNSEWIQKLFPSQDGVSLVANQLESDPMSHLKPDTLGEILNVISKIKDSDLKDKKKLSDLTEDIQNILFRGIAPQKYINILTTKQQALSKKKDKLSKKDCDPKEMSQIDEEIKNLQSVSSLLLEKLENNSTSGSVAGDKNFREFKEGDFKKIAMILVSALKESRSEPRVYPKYLPEQALIAFFLKKFEHKKSFIQLFNHIPHALTQPKVLVSGSLEQQVFLSEKYNESQYDPLKIESNPKKALKYFKENPGELIFSSVQDQLSSSVIPPAVLYGQSDYHTPEGVKKYPDCGETSFRNFFNMIIYDRKRKILDAENLKLLNSPGVQINPKLHDFYKKNSNPAQFMLQEVRNDWSQVMSKNHGVKYKAVESQCEVLVDVDNILNMMDRLLFHGALHGGSIAKANQRSDKLDALCNAVSREGFILSWKAEGGDIHSKDPKLNIDFSVNGDPALRWVFEKNHSHTLSLVPKKDSWSSSVGAEFFKEMSPISLSSHFETEPIALWFATQLMTEKMINSPIVTQDLIYALPLSLYPAKFKAVDMLLMEQPPKPLNRVLLERLVASFPQSDEQIQETLAKMFLRKGYPAEKLIELFDKNPLQKVNGLIWATQVGNVPAVEKMMSKDFPLRSGKNTAAHIAAAQGKTNLMAIFAEKVPEILIEKDGDGRTPVHLAGVEGKIDVIDLIASKAPESMKGQDKYGRTIAFWAAEEKQLNVLKSVLKNVPERLHDKDRYGRNIASWAALNRDVAMIKYIAETNLEVFMEKDKDGKSPLDYIKEQKMKEDVFSSEQIKAIKKMKPTLLKRVKSIIRKT